MTATNELDNTRKWQLLVLGLLVVGVIYLLAPVLTPFAAAALLAYLGDPLVDRLERWMSRTLAVCVVFAAMTLAIVLVVVLLVPMLERQISRFVDQLPTYIAWFRTQATPWLEARFGFQLDTVLDTDKITGMLQQHWREAGGVAATVVASVSKSGFAVIAWLVNLLMIPVVTFYLLRDWDVLVARVHALIPRPIEPTVSTLARESDEVLGAFLRGQLSVMIALGIVYTLGLWLVGIDLALLIGMTAGLISFVPYLGGIVGVLAAVVAALVQYHDVTHVALVLLVFGVGQTLEGMVLTPLLVGDRIGLHPVAVIFAVLAGGELFGFLGILLALPVASVVMVLLRHAHARYMASALYGAPAPDVVAATAAGPVDALPAPAVPDPQKTASPPSIGTTTPTP